MLILLINNIFTRNVNTEHQSQILNYAFLKQGLSFPNSTPTIFRTVKEEARLSARRVYCLQCVHKARGKKAQARMFKHI
jgi:nitrate reductase cytochrome c-type subunit